MHLTLQSIWSISVIAYFVLKICLSRPLFGGRPRRGRLNFWIRQVTTVPEIVVEHLLASLRHFTLECNIWDDRSNGPGDLRLQDISGDLSINVPGI